MDDGLSSVTNMVNDEPAKEEQAGSGAKSEHKESSQDTVESIVVRF